MADGLCFECGGSGPGCTCLKYERDLEEAGDRAAFEAGRSAGLAEAVGVKVADCYRELARDLLAQLGTMKRERDQARELLGRAEGERNAAEHARDNAQRLLALAGEASAAWEEAAKKWEREAHAWESCAKTHEAAAERLEHAAAEQWDSKCILAQATASPAEHKGHGTWGACPANPYRREGA